MPEQSSITNSVYIYHIRPALIAMSVQGVFNRGNMTNEELVTLIEGSNQQENMAAIWEQNKAYVAKMAHKYEHLVEFDDLLQEGYLALCEAVQKYDSSKGALFLTFASYCIKTRYMRYVSSQENICLSELEYRMTNKYKQMVADIRKNIGREPTGEEIKNALGITDRELVKIERYLVFREAVSLDKTVTAYNDLILSDMIADPCNGITESEDKIMYEELKTVLWSTVDSLSADQSAVLHAIYQQGKTLRSIGKELEVAETRVSCVHQSGLRALRHGSRGKVLLPFYDGYIHNMAMQGVGLGTFNRTWTSATEWVALKLV